jgi:hypothetical protein
MMLRRKKRLPTEDRLRKIKEMSHDLFCALELAVYKIRAPPCDYLNSHSFHRIAPADALNGKDTLSSFLSLLKGMAAREHPGCGVPAAPHEASSARWQISSRFPLGSSKKTA